MLKWVGLVKNVWNQGNLSDSKVCVVKCRVENSVKNSTDTIFELEILAQKARAKICINMQKLAKKSTN